jgi:ribose-phosphate pyrophosphokinase
MSCANAGAVTEAIIQAMGKDGRQYAGQTKRVDFSCGEIKHALGESVRGADCWVIQVFNRGDAGDIIKEFYEAKVLLRTLKDCHASSWNLVMPYLPNTRQEKQWGREGYLFKMIVDELLLLGATEIVTFDLHDSACASLFDGHCTHLYTSHVLIPAIREEHPHFDVVCSTDTGSTKMAEFYAKQFDCEAAMMYKGSSRSNEGRKIKVHKLAGEVSGKKVLVVDELNDTGGTLVSGCEFLIDQKGAAEVVVAIAHTQGAGNCQNQLHNLCARSQVKGYYTTDSILQMPGFYETIPKARVISLVPMIKDSILHIHHHESVEGNYLV